MSCNRENVIWQSEDGTWNRAFYDFYDTNTDDPDRDYEWDVEYTDDFNWLVTGLRSEEEADKAWDGANPGGYSVIEFTPANAAHCKRLDEKAAKFKEQASRTRPRSYAW